MTRRTEIRRRRWSALPTGGACALLVLLLATLPALPAGAHPGPLDEYGGHFDKRTGLYHYHRPSKEMAHRKPEYLNWVMLPDKGILKGDVAKVEDADTIWVHMVYRPAFQDVAQHIALANKNERDMLLRVDLAHVSPRETGAQNPRFEEWFLNKVQYELKQKLLGHKVTVNFEIVGGGASRLRGMVFEGKENVNLWMVLNGWSYYVLNDGSNPYDKLFRNAEDIARRDKAGIWQHLP
ncbi:MAG TPA: YHYH domain-containing protein [bacterium]|nr:YHYH domain-containing protein [bacterium]